jgi:mono/diheme cytochrome c family protein
MVLPSSVPKAFCYDASMMRQGSWVLVVLLGGLVACAPAAPSAGAPGERTGADLFNGSCSACHQPNGEGIPGVYPSLAGSPVVLGDPRALLLWVARGERPATMPPGRYSTAMPAFGWLKPADAAALLTYLRSSFGNHAPPVDAASAAIALEGTAR